jgi:Type VI secretion system VasI, EvfG, VC_A0118
MRLRLASLAALTLLLGLAAAQAQSGKAVASGDFPNALPSLLPEGSGVDAVIGAVRFCGGRSDRNVRLDCYDQIGAYLSRTLGAQADREYSWGVQSGEGPGGRRQATIAIEAIATGSQDDATGSLNGKILFTARCRDGATSFYVTFDRPVAPEDGAMADVTLGFGLGPNETKSWEVSRSGNSLGLWRDQVGSKALLTRLLTAPSLRVSSIRPDGKSISATFSMSGYPAALSHVREACAW